MGHPERYRYPFRRPFSFASRARGIRSLPREQRDNKGRYNFIWHFLDLGTNGNYLRELCIIAMRASSSSPSPSLLLLFFPPRGRVRRIYYVVCRYSRFGETRNSVRLISDYFMISYIDRNVWKRFWTRKENVYYLLFHSIILFELFENCIDRANKHWLELELFENIAS